MFLLCCCIFHSLYSCCFPLLHPAVLSVIFFAVFAIPQFSLDLFFCYSCFSMLMWFVSCLELFPCFSSVSNSLLSPALSVISVLQLFFFILLQFSSFFQFFHSLFSHTPSYTSSLCCSSCSSCYQFLCSL